MILATAAAVAPALAQALEPAEVQVQYLPRPGAAIVFWNPVPDATGYHVYQQEVKSPTSDSLEFQKVTTEPVTRTSHTVENLQNGTPYHFRVSAIIDGQETEPVGPTVAQGDQGDFVAVVPQQPVTLVERPFYGFNIGTDYPGSHQVSEQGEITLRASGWDIQSDADGFYFLATPVAGDVTVTVRFVLGPTETPNGTEWNLGGPMIRESLDASARFAMMQAARLGPFQYKWREEYGFSPPEVRNNDVEPATRPVWLRVSRQGNEFTSFMSTDGNEWAQVGDAIEIADFAPEAYVGLTLSAHEDGEYTTADFDNLTITTP
jgi:hypothetical protein